MTISECSDNVYGVVDTSGSTSPLVHYWRPHGIMTVSPEGRQRLMADCDPVTLFAFYDAVTTRHAVNLSSYSLQNDQTHYTITTAMSVCPCVCSNKTNDKAYFCARSPTQIHDLLSVTGFDKIGQKCRKHSQQKKYDKKNIQKVICEI